MISWYLKAAGGKPLTLEENGTYSTSGQDVNDHLTGALTLSPDMLIWWNSDAGDGSGAVALTNTDNSIRTNGFAYKAFITNTPYPHAPPSSGAATPFPVPGC